jgi:tetratricopeptide (TPR) repeat protein
MNSRTALTCLLVFAAVSGGAWYWRHVSSDAGALGSPEWAADAAPRPIPVRPDSEAPYNPNQFNLTTDQSIGVFEQRVRDDPQSHLDLTTLAGLYIRKAREEGDLAAYDRAEAALRRAVAIVPSHLPARNGLAMTACARHRFAEGAAEAQAILREAPDDLEALSVLGDANLELGRYADAERALRELERRGQPPALLVRRARMAELHGDLESAVRLLTQAAEAQRADHDFQHAGAWYSMRLGEVLFAQGQYDSAAQNLEAALALQPRSPAALAILARVRVAQGRVPDAIQLFERALVMNPDLAMIGDLSDLYAKTGNEFRAKLLADSLEKIARDKPEYDRELALHYCNHNRELPKALELARRDFQGRQDIFASDTLAWALFKNGQAKEAEQAIAQALRLGTRDAALFYHAGAIYDQLGERDKARDYLKRALALNPHFSISQSDEARRLSARLADKSTPTPR